MPRHPPFFDAQLSQAQRLEVLGTLAGGIAHDLNNQLTVILGNLAWALELLDPNQRCCAGLRDAQAAAERCVEMTRGLLAFSRRTQPERKAISLDRLFSETERLLRHVIPSSIRIRFLIEAPLQPVVADPTQIQQVLMNLCVNARDAMPQGGLLRVSARNRPGFVSICVTDNGFGMAPEVRERIFEPFYTTKDGQGGTGLGLATVLGIVKSHGGKVQVNSRPNKGTTFCVLLAVAENAAEPEDCRAQLATGQGGCILIGEDDPLVRKAAATVLQLRGYQIYQAADGEQTIQTFSEHADEIDLVFVDVNMPGRSGIQAVEQIRRIRPFVRSLFSSGYPFEVEGPFLAKPYSPADLVRKVQEVLAA